MSISDKATPTVARMTILLICDSVTLLFSGGCELGFLPRFKEESYLLFDQSQAGPTWEIIVSNTLKALKRGGVAVFSFPGGSELPVEEEKTAMPGILMARAFAEVLQLRRTS
jgi:hypothetical protein